MTSGRRQPRRTARVYERLRRQVADEGVASAVAGIRDYVRWRRRRRRGSAIELSPNLDDWHQAYDGIPPEQPVPETGFSIVCPAFNSSPPLLRECVASVIAQSHTNWELILVDDASTRSESIACLTEMAALDDRIRLITLETNQGIAAATNAGLDDARLEYVAFLDHDDVLLEHALAWVSTCTPEADVIYTDDDKIDLDGRGFHENFKPGWSPRLLLSRNYINHLTCVRADLLRRLQGLRLGFDGAQDHDLMLRVAEENPVVAHLPNILYHWREWNETASGAPGTHIEERGLAAISDAIDRRGWEAHPTLGAGEPFNYRVIWDPPRRPARVKIVIPVDEPAASLEGNISAILARSDGVDVHLVVVDHGSGGPAVDVASLQNAGDDVSVLHIDDAFNYGRACNQGSRFGPSAEHLLLLDQRVEVLHRDWLLQLAGWLRDPRVMGAGPKLLSPDRRLRHAGLVLGHSGVVAGYAFDQLDEPQHGNLHDQAREVWGLSSACLLMRSSDFEKVGGFVEGPLDGHQDVDLCARMHRDLGGNFMFDPTYPLVNRDVAAGTAYAASRVRFWWREEIAAGDPFYSPHLSLERHDLSMRRVPDREIERRTRLQPRWSRS